TPPQLHAGHQSTLTALRGVTGGGRVGSALQHLRKTLEHLSRVSLPRGKWPGQPRVPAGPGTARPATAALESARSGAGAHRRGLTAQQIRSPWHEKSPDRSLCRGFWLRLNQTQSADITYWDSSVRQYLPE